jgi:hypothetical protein
MKKCLMYRGALYRLSGSQNPVMPPISSLSSFTRAYLASAMDNNHEGVVSAYSLSPSRLRQIMLDCTKFQKLHPDIISMMGSQRAGHYFWTTRNDPTSGFAAQPLPPDLKAEVLATCRNFGPFTLKDPRWEQGSRMWEYEQGGDY